MKSRQSQVPDISQSDMSEMAGQADLSSFEALPNEISEIIIKSRSKSDIDSLVGSSTHFYTLFQPKRLHAKFLSATLMANLGAVKLLLTLNAPSEKQLALNPHYDGARLDLLYQLLCCRGTVSDRPDRTFKDVTALQLAYGAQDVEMCELLLEFFARLPNGYQEAASQLNEKFSMPMYKTVSREFIGACYDLFSYTNRPELSWESAIAEFWAESKRDVELSSFHFNLRQITQLLSIYNDYFMDQNFGYVWREGVGYLERQFPVCHLARLCEGFMKSYYPRGERSLTLADGTLVFPFSDQDGDRLGVDYAITVSGIKTVGGETKDMVDERNYSAIESYIDETEKALERFRAKLNRLALINRSAEERENSRLQR